MHAHIDCCSIVKRHLFHWHAFCLSIKCQLSSSDEDDEESIGGSNDLVSLSCSVNKDIERKSNNNCRSAIFSK